MNEEELSPPLSPPHCIVCKRSNAHCIVFHEQNNYSTFWSHFKYYPAGMSCACTLTHGWSQCRYSRLEVEYRKRKEADPSPPVISPRVNCWLIDDEFVRSLSQSNISFGTDRLQSTYWHPTGNMWDMLVIAAACSHIQDEWHGRELPPSTVKWLYLC